MKEPERKNNIRSAIIYCGMIFLFGLLIYLALMVGERFEHYHATPDKVGALDAFFQTMLDNLNSHFVRLLMQITLILLSIRLFSLIFQKIGQPGVIGEIVAGIVLGPSLFGACFPHAFHFVFPESSFEILGIFSQIGLVLFMFVIGLEMDFNLLKNKINKTLIISHAGIVIPFFLGVALSILVYEKYVSDTTPFIPFALFMGISMSITAFPVLARILEEKNMIRTNIGMLSIASAANDDVTAWCLLAMVIAIAKAGTVVSTLFTIGVIFGYLLFMFLVLKPLLERIAKK